MTTRDSGQGDSTPGPAGLGRRGALRAGLAAAALAGTGAWRSAPRAARSGAAGSRAAAPGAAGPGGPLRGPGSLPYPALPEGTDTIPQIEHIVVLMMENHSYDNQLGMLRRPGADGFRLGPRRPAAGQPIPTRTATSSTRSGCPPPARTARRRQEWMQSHIQFDNGRNDGFVQSASGPTAMGYWEQADQPFYYSMASVFPIADRYFCSVLGQTYPNRRYLISATSLGLVDDTTPGLSDYPPNGTIFDRLDAQGLSWKDYYTDLATTELYPPLYLKNLGTNVVPIAGFFTAAAAAPCPASAWWNRTTAPSPRKTRRTSRSASSSPPGSSTR